MNLLFQDRGSAPIVPKSGTVGANMADNAPVVPEFGTVSALRMEEPP